MEKRIVLNGNAIKPLYEQLKDHLEAAILNGKIKPNEQLLPEVKMAEKYCVSVITIRKALNDLARKGLIEKRQGKGTFVSSKKYQRDLNQVISFSEACKIAGTRPGTKLITSTIEIPSDAVLKELHLDSGTKTVYIARLRFMDDVPMQIERTYFPLTFSFLLDEDLEHKSLFKLIQDRSNRTVARSKRVIEIWRASSQEAQQLEVGRNSPLLCVQGTAYDQDDEIVYVGLQLINGERYKLYI
jgi:GntR family transcriptional regulator